MTDTLLIAGFEVDGEVANIPAEWDQVKPSDVDGWFLIHALELKRAFIVHSMAMVRSGKRIGQSDLMKIIDSTEPDMKPILKSSIKRLSQWGLINEHGIFSVGYHPTTIRFYQFRMPTVELIKTE